jgi:riboflavin transporter FmnP
MQSMTKREKTFSVKLLAKLGMLTALAVVLTWLIHFPVIPAAPFLVYDPADIPILIGTFAFGPLAGLLLTVATAGVQAFTVSADAGLMGFLMHTIATGSMAVTCGLIFFRSKSWKTAALGLALGTIVMTAVMIPLNLLLTPLFMGAPVQVVADMIIPAILPFNLIKVGINSVVTFILYKKSSQILSSF